MTIETLFFLGATTDNLPPGVLYKVKATYKYQAEDMDELQFEVGEIIDVIEYEDPEEQVRDVRIKKIFAIINIFFRRKVGSWA